MGHARGCRGLLIVGSGCADLRARAAHIEPLERALAKAFHLDGREEEPVRIAYTSDGVRVSPGLRALDVADALEDLWAAGVRDLTVASTHLIGGSMHEGARRIVGAKAHLFDAVRMTSPLLSCPSDAAALALAIDSRYPRRDSEAVALVGHGADGAGQLAYLALGYELHVRGRSDVLVGALRGDPSFAEVADGLMRAGAEAVTVVPLMLAAGGHARRDVLGTNGQSWAGRLVAAGLHVRSAADGLGAWPEVHALACEHLRDAVPLPPCEKAGPPPRDSGRFPLFVDLSGKRCLVVGGGTVGCRRAAALARFGARVTMVDPAPSDRGRGSVGELICRRYRPGDENGCAVVIASTNDREVNRMLGERCRRLGIPVSVADAPGECTFFFPALCEGERVVCGVVSRDATPDGHALTARVAAQIRDILP